MPREMPTASTIKAAPVGASGIDQAARTSPGLNEDSAAKRVKQRFLRHAADDKLPLQMTHDRIYILPTARGWVYVMTLLIMLVTSINYALSLGYALCFLLTGLFSATLMATYKNIAGIRLERVTSQTGVAGADTEFALTLGNARRRHCHALLLQNDSGQRTTAVVPSEGSVRVQLRVPTTTRGWQPLGRVTLSSEYPLGLWNAWGYMHAPSHSLIWPKPETAAPAIPAPRTSSSDAAEKVGVSISNQQNQGEFSALRDYREGDSITAIAWKQTARGQGLMAREFEESASTKVTLDWQDCSGASGTEEKISRLAAWCYECSTKGIDYSLRLPENLSIVKEAKDSALHHHSNCMKALALHGKAQTTSDNG